jgi:hypothetical protein
MRARARKLPIAAPKGALFQHFRLLEDMDSRRIRQAVGQADDQQTGSDGRLRNIG